MTIKFEFSILINISQSSALYNSNIKIFLHTFPIFSKEKHILLVFFRNIFIKWTFHIISAVNIDSPYDSTYFHSHFVTAKLYLRGKNFKNSKNR